MKSLKEDKIKRLLHDMSVLQPRDSSKIEKMGKYVSNIEKNVYVCLHPSATVHYYHTHDFFEVNYVYQGNCINMVEGESLQMSVGDFLLLHPGTFHTVYADTQSKVVNLLIRSNFFTRNFSRIDGNVVSSLSMFLSKAGNNSYYKYVLGSAKNMQSDITNLMSEEAEANPNSDIVQEALLTLFLCRLVRTDSEMTLSDIRGVSSNIIIDILQYMYDNYNVATLSTVSEKFCYSPSHICRMFTKQTGKTFGNTLTEIRMEKSAAYLRESNKKIKEIAKLTGYESVEYFHRLFKSKFGVSPLQFRNMPLN